MSATPTHKHTYIYIHIYEFVCMHIYLRVCSLCTYVCIHICVCTVSDPNTPTTCSTTTRSTSCRYSQKPALQPFCITN